MTKMIDSKAILYSKGKNDECFTPDYGVKPILKHIIKYQKKLKKILVVWCPFDKENSKT